MDSPWVDARARNTSNELRILLTAKNDFIKNDSNSMDIKTIIPVSIINKNM